MILPHPETDLNLNILVLGAELIKKLSLPKDKFRFILIETLLQDFISQDERRTPDLFFHTLTFLYLTGLIEWKNYKVKILKSEK
ncbi:MAG: hypothetical protein EHM58_13410 [Ignavibacteriae bacterium]|nr:MAG: hypothetical protein EHM58_13410 [Ignavibacteriota bacterium]